ncbi:MAG: hypothetical protein IT303_18045 [Dehalococcoidia bacterium]|nr:hypothetical protein [Dehalococcoidia bacterium]
MPDEAKNIAEEDDVPSNVTPLNAAAGVGVDRRAEGGLTLRFAFDLPKLPSVMSVRTWTHQQMINGALIAAVLLMAAFIIYKEVFASEAGATNEAAAADHNIRPNVTTAFNPSTEEPAIAAGAYVDTLASVIGNVSVGSGVFVAPFASIRGDEGQPIIIGAGSNVQDGVVLHALETYHDGETIEKNLVTVDGKKYAVFIGEGVSLAHQSQVHGPAAIGDHTFVGMQAFVFKATVGKNVVIEPAARVIGVTIADGHYVPAGAVITTQAQADALPVITDDYGFAKLNDGVLEVNEAFADAYLEAGAGGHVEEGASSGSASGHATATGTTTAKKTATATKTTASSHADESATKPATATKTTTSAGHD